MTGVGFAQWDEYGMALACFIVGSTILLLKAWHFEAKHWILKILRAFFIAGAIIMIASSYTITAARKGSGPWSAYVAAKWPSIPDPPRPILPSPPLEPPPIAAGRPTLAEVGLRLIYTEKPMIVITNPSSVSAHDPKYIVVLFNLDSDDINPLPIPVRTFADDYIIPDGGVGPYDVLGLPGVSPLIRSGDRLFGHIEVQCSNCTAFRDYWVFIRVGEGGWYSQVRSGSQVDDNVLFQSMSTIRKNIDTFIAEIIPNAGREPIRDLPRLSSQ
ncbi:MAG: hypothetical protein HY313_05085 [Acidobacteria bacterium]|nr:hypothetical protein [Acidobacteriota bacterium]